MFGLGSTGAVVSAKLFPPKGREIKSVSGLRVTAAKDDKGRSIPGIVEDGNNEHQPWWMPSLDLAFGERPFFAWTLLLLPWLVVAACVRRGTPALARAFALVCATGMLAVCLAALFGDGDVE